MEKSQQEVDKSAMVWITDISAEVDVTIQVTVCMH